MSAEDKWHEDTPKKDGEPNFPQARISAMQTLGRQENGAPLERPGPHPHQLLQAFRHEKLEDGEIRARLLSAIESTDIAARLQAQAAPRDTGRHLTETTPLPCGSEVPTAGPAARASTEPDAPTATPAYPTARSAWPKTFESVPLAAARVAPPAAARGQQFPAPAAPRIGTAAGRAQALVIEAPRRAASAAHLPSPGAPTRQPLGQAPRKAADPVPAAARMAPLPALFPQQLPSLAGSRRGTVARRPFTFLVQASPQASARLMPPPNAPSRRPPHAIAPNAAHSRPAVVAQRVSWPPQPATAGEPAAAVNPTSLFASIQADSPSAPTSLWGGQIAHFAAEAARSALGAMRAAIRVATAFMSWLGVKISRSLKVVARGATQFSSELRSSLETKAAPAMLRLARAAAQPIVALGHWLGTKGPLILECAGRTAVRVSAWIGTWLVTEAGRALKGVVRAATQSATAVERGVERIVPLILKSARQGAAQLSTRLKAWRAARTARRLESAAQARAQLSTRVSLEGAAALSIESTPQAGRSTARAETQPVTRFKRWFGPRSGTRLAEPPLVAYCWTADTPGSVKIADISSGGLHLMTDVRWPLGSTISTTLQRTDKAKEAPGSWIVIEFMVVRWCEDGLAGSFIPYTPGRYYANPAWSEYCADPRTLKHFVKQLAVPAYR